MDETDRRLLDEFQRDFPLDARPYRILAQKLGTSEADILERLERLQESGTVSRIGGVFRPGSVGASTLAAMSIAPDLLDEVAGTVSSYRQVNHNYEREHTYNLWFVVNGDSQQDVVETIHALEKETGHKALNLPLVEPYHLDLGFNLSWK